MQILVVQEFSETLRKLTTQCTFLTEHTWRWTTQDCTATKACLKISNEKASVGKSKGYCCLQNPHHKRLIRWINEK